MKMTRGSEDGLPFIAPTSRRRLRATRIWSSLSRLQRNLITGFLVMAAVSATYLVFAYSELRPSIVPIEPALSKKPGSSVYIPRKQGNSRLSNPPIATGPESDKAEHGEGQAPNRAEGIQLVQPKMPHFTGPENDRQKAVVAAFKHAWKGYKTYAWGKDHLKPVSKSSGTWMNLGLTILDNLDTLLIFGLDEEFEEAKKWVETELNLDNNHYVNLFETTIRALGGLLSAYHLSGEEVFLSKAKELGLRLSGAFDTPSRVPFSDVNLSSKRGKLPSWGAESSLSEVTTLQLEFRDLSRASGNPYFEKLAFNVSQHIHKKGCSKFQGLCPMYLNPKTGEFKNGYTITLGARTDSYYEYLLKQWLQVGKTIDWLKDDYAQAMEGTVQQLVRYSEPNKLTFIGELVSEKSFSPKMDHLVCFLAGTLALGAVNGIGTGHMDLAQQLGHTCHQMYRNPTGLGPEIAHFNMILTPNREDLYIKPLDAHSLLRPEAIEGWFYLYRLTGEKIYQEWGWEAFQAIEKHAKIRSGGYSSVANVKKIPVVHRDMMESFFLAETLKYLYLLLADDQSILPLSDYVFNTEAHPLPIRAS